MRKILKKVVAAVATATVCCAMMTPVAAKAANPGVCTHRNMLLGIETLSYNDEEAHIYVYLCDADGDGNEEIVWDFCDIIVAEYAYAYMCSCGYSELLPNMAPWTEETHSDAGSKYHYY